MNKRPEISQAIVSSETSKEEAFQNTVLRPIIKMKHDLLIAYTKHYLAKKKSDFSSLSLEKRLAYLGTCFEQDNTLRSELRGVAIGQFTVKEYDQYSFIRNSVNKRIMNIIKERMLDHVDVLTH